MTPSPRPVVVLFDIDGTLVSCGGAGRRAMERAFDEHALARSTSDFSFGGMTDRAIVREAMVRGGRDVDDALLEATLARYLTHLADELPRSTGYTVLPGVGRAIALLEGARSSERPIAIGLGTGNLVRGAEIKLRPAALWERFAFGGYGSDHEDRARLLRRGVERGAESLGRDPDDVSVIVIGDTPRDVIAAHAIGARCLAVATGAFGVDELRSHAPHAVLGTLDELTIHHVLG